MNSYRLKKTEELILRIISDNSPGKLNAQRVATAITTQIPLLSRRITELVEILTENVGYAEKSNRIMEIVEAEKYWLITVNDPAVNVPIPVTHYGSITVFLKNYQKHRRGSSILWSHEISLEEYLQYNKEE